MFQRYSENARRVIFFAHHHAVAFGSLTIETEHLLLGVFQEIRPPLSKLVAGRSVDYFRERIERERPPAKPLIKQLDLPVSEECKRVLAYATEEANRSHSRLIQPEHIFLGLLRKKGSLAAKLLEADGISLEGIRSGLGPSGDGLYCPNCAQEVTDPLTCGDCSAVICRVCGTPLESPDELGIG